MLDKLKQNEDLYYKVRMIGKVSFMSEDFRKQLSLNGLDPFWFIYSKDDPLISRFNEIKKFVTNLIEHHKVLKYAYLLYLKKLKQNFML